MSFYTWSLKIPGSLTSVLQNEAERRNVTGQFVSWHFFVFLFYMYCHYFSPGLSTPVAYDQLRWVQFHPKFVNIQLSFLLPLLHPYL